MSLTLSEAGIGSIAKDVRGGQMQQCVAELLTRQIRQPRHMLLGGIVFVCATLSACSSTGTESNPRLDDHGAAIACEPSNMNIAPWAISFEPDPRDIADLGKGRSISVVPETHPDNIEQARAAVERGLCKYSATLRQRLNLRVLCVASVTVDGKMVSGLNSKENGVAMLTTRNAEQRSDPRRIEQVLHHELSSILVWQNLDAFPTAFWESANPDGFKYSGQDPMQFSGEAPGNIATLQDLESGFLGKYAQIDPMQDINRVAEQMMMEEPRYAAAIKVYPRLRQKALAYAIFLARIDPPLGRKAMAFVRAATEE